MVVDAIEQALKDRPDADARHRIEHCGLPDPVDIKRMAELGIRPVNQTQHYYNWGEGVEQAIGTPGERFNPLGEFRDAGVPATLSSDAPVAEPLPLEAIQAAVTRVTRRGHKLGPDDLCISAEAALRAHTLEGAVSLGRDNEFGSLTPVNEPTLSCSVTTHWRRPRSQLRQYRSWRPGSTGARGSKRTPNPSSSPRPS